ncbi:MAG: hypothetical protein E6H88_00800 [Chloroflexi bacterium]|nr:MAG: hypothetical protein E6H88_00800 [Chloroflexota bacterium]
MAQRPLEASTGPSRAHLDPDSTLRQRPAANTLAGHMVWGANVSCPKCGAGMPADYVYCGRCGTRLESPGEVEGETRQVTVLFADISGFTALAERLGPEELHENMRTAWDAIAAEIRANGGLIEKYIGDAVVAVFGAVDEDEGHPEQAQHAALAILGALERTNARIEGRTGRRLALRVGVNTGIAVAGAIGDKESEFGVLGDAVNVAARLEQAAEPGEILIGDATYRRTPGVFAYEPHPPVAAKGKTAPLVAWRLLRTEAAGAREGRRAPLVGRDAEVALLVGALDEALAGKGRIVSIVAEAGLGKSRLVDEVIADPRARGARVARARCSPYDAHRAYGAISDLLRRALAISTTSSVDHAHRVLTETLPGLEPDTRSLLLTALGYAVPLPALSSETRRRMLDHGIHELILRVAKTQGVILALTDVQWCDAASQDVLAALAPSLLEVAAFVVTTYRPELTPAWTTARTHLQLRLGPLDQTGAQTLLQALLPQGALPPEAIAEVATRTEGGPTYLVEAAHWLVATGVVVQRDDSTPLADVGRVSELPGTLPMLLLRRAESASAEERRVLHATAVAARSCDPALLRALFGGDLDVDACLAGLVAKGLLEVSGRGEYRFRQAFLRELVYGSMLVRHRQELHGRLGQVIENVLPEVAIQQPELLADHYANSAHPARAIDYGMRAGGRAEALHDLADALHHYRNVAEVAQGLPDGNEARAVALLRASDAARGLGREGDALTLAEEGLAGAPAEGEVRGALRRRAGELAARARAVERSAEHLAEAERLTPETGPERAELTLAKAYLARSDDRTNEALMIARAAEKEALAAEARPIALRAEEAIVEFASAAGSREEATRALERCVEHANAIGDLSSLARALSTLTYYALDRGDNAAAERLGNDLLAAAVRLGDVAGEAAALRALGRAFFGQGRWSEADGALGRALGLADPLTQGPQLADPSATLLTLGTLALERGDLATAGTTLAEARALAERSPGRKHLIPRVATELARLALEKGAVEDARQHAAAAYTAQHAHECRRCGAGIAATLVEVASAAGELTTAEARRAEGLEDAFRLNLPVAAAEIRYAAARLQVARGDLVAARAEAEAALATFEQLGPPHWAERARRRVVELNTLAREQTA